MRPYTVTIDIEFDMPMSGSIAEYREDLDDLERLVPREYRDDVIISWSGASSWDVPYATCSAYYEKADSPEEAAARIAEATAAQEAYKQSQINYFRAQIARLES